MFWLINASILPILKRSNLFKVKRYPYALYCFWSPVNNLKVNWKRSRFGYARLRTSVSISKLFFVCFCVKQRNTFDEFNYRNQFKTLHSIKQDCYQLYCTEWYHYAIRTEYSSNAHAGNPRQAGKWLLNIATLMWDTIKCIQHRIIQIISYLKNAIFLKSSFFLLVKCRV